ncbi:hypothetical protein [Curtobacterium ammoniigenes]|uniref:hypothetical protein n=1 Tax=Curtobacterium ammoniigenes TaxID=395387 RepID=UPI0012EDB6F8|nr:hypothetical protein [Curtobacterium ammoniigenes]
MQTLIARLAVLGVGCVALVVSVTASGSVPAPVRGFLASMSACAILAFLPASHSSVAPPPQSLIPEPPGASGAPERSGSRDRSAPTGSLGFGTPSGRSLAASPASSASCASPRASGAGGQQQTSSDSLLVVLGRRVQAAGDSSDPDGLPRSGVIADAAGGIAVIGCNPVGRSIFRSLVAELAVAGAERGLGPVRVVGERIDHDTLVPLWHPQVAIEAPISDGTGTESAAVAVLVGTHQTPVASIALLADPVAARGAGAVLRADTGPIRLVAHDGAVLLEPTLARLQPRRESANDQRVT